MSGTVDPTTGQGGDGLRAGLEALAAEWETYDADTEDLIKANPGTPAAILRATRSVRRRHAATVRALLAAHPEPTPASGLVDLIDQHAAIDDHGLGVVACNCGAAVTDATYAAHVAAKVTAWAQNARGCDLTAAGVETAPGDHHGSERPSGREKGER